MMLGAASGPDAAGDGDASAADDVVAGAVVTVAPMTLRILEFIVGTYQEDWHVFDSLGEGYVALGPPPRD